MPASAERPAHSHPAPPLACSSYRNLGVLRRELPRLPIMALTATASERVQADIVRSLALRDPLLLRASFNRPEICYEGGRGGRAALMPVLL